MITTQTRIKVINDVNEAVDAGSKRSSACELVGLAESTLRRWKPKGEDSIRSDQRPLVEKPVPGNKLSEQEQQHILSICNESAYNHLPPSQIVPQLADKGIYVASESSFYRVLKAHGQLKHRGRAKQKQSRTPDTHIVLKPNAVWMWDITYLATRTIGKHYYLYMVEDLYSRYGVHWEVHPVESGELGAQLMSQAALKVASCDGMPVLHSDNGSPMKSFTMRAKLEALGIKPSYSRPRVSNDNAYIESMFRTVKYCPAWPSQGFDSLEAARQWVGKFMQWYNEEHRHSAIRYVTPGQRYRGEDSALLAKREVVYQEAKAAKPNRWSGQTRNWRPCGAVALNPQKEVLLAA